MSTLNANAQSAFLSTSTVWPEDPSQLSYTLTFRDSQLANAVNIRDISLYDLVEVINGQQFFDTTSQQKKRIAFRKVFNIGAVGSGATVDTPTGITGVTTFTRIYGVGQVSTTQWRPIPYVSTAAVNQQVSIEVLDIAGVQNIEIVSGAAATAFTNVIVVLEYLKQ